MSVYDKIVDLKIELKVLNEQLEKDFDIAEKEEELIEKRVKLCERAWSEHPDESTGIALDKAYNSLEIIAHNKKILEDKIASIKRAIKKINIATYDLTWIEP